MEFIYVLKLIDRLIPEENWTQEDEAIIGEHFNHLVGLKEKGTLLLAGKTSGQDEDTMGICIFKANSLEEATSIMKNDPAVRKGIMTARLWQYDLALLNSEYKKKD